MNASEISSPSSTLWMEGPTWQNFEGRTQSTEENVILKISPYAELLREVNAVLWNVMPPVLLAFGTFGNVMTVVVMRGMRASQSTACLSLFFTALAVSDQLQLMLTLIFYWVQMAFTWPPSLFRFNILCPVPKFVWNVAGITSAWFLVAMTYQRVTSVVTPHRVGVLCTVRRGKIIVAIITLVGCAFNIHFLFTWIYYPEYEDCHFRKKYEYLIDYFELQDMFCVSVFPFILLAIGNSILIWHVIRSVRFSRKMRGCVDQSETSETGKVYSMSVTLIITSAAFLLLTIPDSIFDVYLKMSYMDISDDDHDAMINLVMTFCLACLMTSVASNFYLYLLTGKKFREEAKRYLCCQGTEQLASTSTLHMSQTSTNENNKAKRQTVIGMQKSKKM